MSGGTLELAVVEPDPVLRAGIDVEGSPGHGRPAHRLHAYGTLKERRLVDGFEAPLRHTRGNVEGRDVAQLAHRDERSTAHRAALHPHHAADLVRCEGRGASSRTHGSHGGPPGTFSLSGVREESTRRIKGRSRAGSMASIE